MPGVPLTKVKKNYTVSVPRHQKKVSQHAKLAKMHSQLAYGGILKKKITRTKSDKKNLQQ